MSPAVVTRVVGPDEFSDLATLFAASRNTRRCWCTAFCTTRSAFAWGWVTGRNQRRFHEVSDSDPSAMGILAFVSGSPVGWVACGPRTRYARSTAGRSSLLRHTEHAEDDSVWLVACYFIHADHRSQGVSHALLSAAIRLAREEGITAVEGWPLAAGHHSTADAHVGREELYEALDFTCVARPTPQRTIMRLELTHS